MNTNKRQPLETLQGQRVKLCSAIASDKEDRLSGSTGSHVVDKPSGRWRQRFLQYYTSDRHLPEGGSIATPPEFRLNRLSYGQNAEFAWMVGGNPSDTRSLTEEEVDQWYEPMCLEALHWVIEVDGHCIGTTRLHSLDWQDRRASYAIGIFNSAYWSKGYGTEATRLVLGYAFEQLHLHRITVRVLEFNQRAIACYKKCGFSKEGIERESALIGEKWYNDIMMSILEQEYHFHTPELAGEEAAQ